MASLELADEFNLFQSKVPRLNVVSRHTETVRGTYIAPRFPGTSTFTIPPSPTHFTSTKILLKMVFQVKKKTTAGEARIMSTGTDPDRVAIVNNFLQSAYSTVQLSMNGVTIQNPPAGAVPYLAYLRTLLSTSAEYKKDILRTTQGWISDEGLNFDRTDSDNTGFEKRADLIDGSFVTTMIGELPLDVSSSFQALPPGIELGINLVHADDSFRLHGKKKDGVTYFVDFLSQELLITRIALRDDLVKEFRSKLIKQPAELSVSRLSLNGPHEIMEGQATCKRLITLSRVPGLCLIFLVSADSTYDLQRNPFNFQHFGLRKARIVFDSRPYPLMDEESSATFETATRDETLNAMHWFRSLLETSGVDNSFSSGLTYERFLNSSTIISIKLVAEQLTRHYTTVNPVGRTELWLEFTQPLKQRVFAYVAGLFGDAITFSSDNLISTTFLPGAW